MNLPKTQHPNQFQHPIILPNSSRFNHASAIKLAKRMISDLVWRSCKRWRSHFLCVLMSLVVKGGIRIFCSRGSAREWWKSHFLSGSLFLNGDGAPFSFRGNLVGRGEARIPICKHLQISLRSEGRRNSWENCWREKCSIFFWLGYTGEGELHFLFARIC